MQERQRDPAPPASRLRPVMTVLTDMPACRRRRFHPWGHRSNENFLGKLLSFFPSVFWGLGPLPLSLPGLRAPYFIACLGNGQAREVRPAGHQPRAAHFAETGSCVQVSDEAGE